METPNYKYFQNKKCDYYPCHNGVPEEEFNCLFCYCPLYALGEQCGGRFNYTQSGIKNCTDCTVPHRISNYDYIVKKAKLLVEQVKKK